MRQCRSGSLRACVAGAATAPQLSAALLTPSSPARSKSNQAIQRKQGQPDEQARGGEITVGGPGRGRRVRNGSRRRLVSPPALSSMPLRRRGWPASGVLQRYDRAFVLENEKEGYDGFVECSGSIAAINMTTSSGATARSRVCDRGAGGSDGGAPGRGQLSSFFRPRSRRRVAWSCR